MKDNSGNQGTENGGFTGIGGPLVGLLAHLFGGEGHWENPGTKAMGFLNQIPDTLKQYYNPYINSGYSGLQSLEGQYPSLLNSPGQKLNQIGQSYQQSPGLQYSIDQAKSASNNAAAAGGMLGSSSQQHWLSKDITGLANQDYENWMNHALSLYGQGLNTANHIFDTGAEASNNLAQGLGQNLTNQSGLQYKTTQAENEHSAGQAAGFWGNLANMASIATSPKTYLGSKI